MAGHLETLVAQAPRQKAAILVSARAVFFRCFGRLMSHDKRL
jgi:hypothetical protein